MTQVKIAECLEPGLKVAVTEASADGKPAVMIRANRQGLITLARLFMFMTQPNVHAGVAVDLKLCGALDPASPTNVLIVKD